MAVVVTYEMCHQMSDFEYLGKVSNVLSMQVIEEIVNEKCEIRESYAVKLYPNVKGLPCNGDNIGL